MARARAPKKAALASAADAGPDPDSAVSVADEEQLPFEAALSRLEDVVDRLEGGDLELEAALASFEEGVRLTRHCSEQLDAAERRIEVLRKEGDQWVARPFGGDPGAGASDDQGSEE